MAGARPKDRARRPGNSGHHSLPPPVRAYCHASMFLDPKCVLMYCCMGCHDRGEEGCRCVFIEGGNPDGLDMDHNLGWHKACAHTCELGPYVGNLPAVI